MRSPWSHAPFDVGECMLCHVGGDTKNPGPIRTASANEICLACHEEIKRRMTTAAQTHAAAQENCVDCHNPHNSEFPKLLIKPPPALCFDCHRDIEKVATQSPVKHGALADERSCLNCHDPHAADVEHLLVALPYDSCVTCHSNDEMTDTQGKKLANIKKLLDENPVKHGPVAKKDCSACHQPHGSQNFRLLVEPYPAEFYSPYEPANYALCFRCHNDQIVATAKTTTLTKFRNGDANMHYLHVRGAKRGRSCRACHEVHASKKPHQIRDSVPFGKLGRELTVVYTPIPGGGRCAKTCHSARTYRYEPKPPTTERPRPGRHRWKKRHR